MEQLIAMYANELNIPLRYSKRAGQHGFHEVWLHEKLLFSNLQADMISVFLEGFKSGVTLNHD